MPQSTFDDKLTLFQLMALHGMCLDSQNTTKALPLMGQL